ncbi:DUF6344 domain-containing protein [Streptomyces sp. 15-116A]|uniref:DUF6344 domain-containing protein n=1 Tax=Streptomyces sp. 15-116A TaxID=2259035 RepID=UPI0021B19BF9|nr:DUF6344 domain-containing protein [Streptomyces sp. 15-116A]MCT7356230.1 DUF6344 domain-containing protein [Streptomyces sp. 15-116A]
MARNKVMKLWTVVVTAFLALFTALGLITTTASAAVQQAETTRNRESAPDATAPAPSFRSWSRPSALPPTMKQRIRAEAHGKSPSCRHLPLADTAADPLTCYTDTKPASESSTADTPLQR